MRNLARKISVGFLKTWAIRTQLSPLSSKNDTERNFLDVKTQLTSLS